MRVVVYLMDGTFHATRHADTCGVLARAQRAENGELQPAKGGRPRIWDEDLFHRLPDKPPLKDHVCVARALARAAPEPVG